MTNPWDQPMAQSQVDWRVRAMSDAVFDRLVAGELPPDLESRLILRVCPRKLDYQVTTRLQYVLTNESERRRGILLMFARRVAERFAHSDRTALEAVREALEGEETFW